ncbi:MAG TPA: helix-hairpin-helix domain-containing protein [Nitrospira sp.]|nr:helix-hairpin-helix domain-containing protein [Nitrospira sp.]
MDDRFSAPSESGATLFVFPTIIILIAVITASVGAFNVWWISQPPPSSGLVDINTATVADLTTLSQVDLATAERIAAERPYDRVEDLVQRHIVPQQTYDKIKDQIVAIRQ